MIAVVVLAGGLLGAAAPASADCSTPGIASPPTATRATIGQDIVIAGNRKFCVWSSGSCGSGKGTGLRSADSVDILVSQGASPQQQTWRSGRVTKGAFEPDGSFTRTVRIPSSTRAGYANLELRGRFDGSTERSGWITISLEPPQ